MGSTPRRSDATPSNEALDSLRTRLADLDRDLGQAEENEAARVADLTAQLAESRERQARAESKVEAMKGLVTEP